MPAEGSVAAQDLPSCEQRRQFFPINAFCLRHKTRFAALCSKSLCITHTETRIRLFGLQRRTNRLLTRLVDPVAETQPLFKQARVLILLVAHPAQYRRLVA